MGEGEGGRGPVRRDRDLARSSSAIVVWVRVELGVKEEAGGLTPGNMPVWRRNRVTIPWSYQQPWATH